MNKITWVLLTFVSLFLSFTSGYNDDDNSPSTVSTDPTVVILFMFVGLLLGIVVQQILSRIGEPIPYAVTIFILGIILSTLTRTNTPNLLTDSINDWVEIDADLIVYIFLPPLIFGEAMGLNWHHAQAALPACTVLAGPGVVIGTILLAVFTKYFIPYGWDWKLSLVFGSILSTTDTVAVVSIMKSAGAPAKLMMLISGESLLNDGTAMVLYTLFYNMLQGQTYTAMQIFNFFLSATFGSMLLGIGTGLVIVYWLRTANRPLKETDSYIQISITLVSAYLLFFVAQYDCAISGALSCCFGGLVLAWKAPPIFLSRESLHHVWGIVDWMGNTLIFLLAGLIIGHRSLGHVRPRDWFYLFVLYVMTIAIRAFVVLISFPFLSNKQHEMTYSEGIFMVWGGLHGALSMALALSIQNNPNIYPTDPDEPSRLLFYVGGVAALSLLINATTARRLLDYLEIGDDNSIEKELVMNKIKRRLRKNMILILQELAETTGLKQEEIEDIRMSCTLLRDYEPEEFSNKVRASIISRPSVVGGGEITSRYSTATVTAAAPPVSVPPPSQQQPKVPFQSQLQLPAQSVGAKHGSMSKRIRSKRIASIRFDSDSDSDLDESDFDSSFTKRSSANSRQSNDSRGSFRHRDQSTINRFQSRLQSMSRLLSRNGRDKSTMEVDLLAYVRAVFLEIVRVKYWKFIDDGKLPRLSHSAQYLLYTVEVGLDETRSVKGLQDWPLIESYVITKPLHMRLLLFMHNIVPTMEAFTLYIGRLEAKHDKRCVYMLTSFIESHLHAQKKIHSFLGVDEHESNPINDPEADSAHASNLLSPEEIRVKQESDNFVRKAKEFLNQVPQEILHAIQSKQIARSILSQETEMVKNMLDEGLLSIEHAEELFEEIERDVNKIENQRNNMYKEHAKFSAKKFTNPMSVFTSATSSTVDGGPVIGSELLLGSIRSSNSNRKSDSMNPIQLHQQRDSQQQER